MAWQPHLLSIAENINEAEFNPKEYERIDAVISKEGERIQVSVTYIWPDLLLYDLLKMLDVFFIWN